MIPVSSATVRTPRISVVIPTYNRAHYLPLAIDSVLQQTCADVELIVVDDGSTDDTRERLTAYRDRVTYIATRNLGAGHARNVGMRAARGQYLAFLDSDDLFYPYMLEVESTLLDLYPDVAMVYAETSAFDDGEFFDRFHLQTYHHSAYRNPQVTYDRLFDRSVQLGDVSALRDLLAHEDPTLLERRAYFGNIFSRYLENIVVFQNNMLMRREVVATVGVRKERVKYYEELDYILRITRRHRVCFVDVPTYKLRYHDGQISTTSRKDGRYVWLRKQQELLHVVKEHAVEDAAYYQEHRVRIDRHLAHLHRAVAVPLMLADGPARRGRTYARRARKYLARAARYGYPHRGLWLMTFTPGVVRRFGVSLVEYARMWSHRWAAWSERRAA